MNESYSDRLAKAELYLSRAESRLDAEVQGTRLYRQLWLVTECLSTIDREAGLEAAKLDAAGQDLGELENITIALTRLAQRRRLLFIRVAEKYGLDAHLLIAGDSIEMERLEYRLDDKQPPPDDTQWKLVTTAEAADHFAKTSKAINDWVSKRTPSPIKIVRVRRGWVKIHPDDWKT